MRFSKHQTLSPSDPQQERGRRRAKFVGDIKTEIKEGLALKGSSLSKTAIDMDCNKSVISRALDPSSNIEVFTMFDFAEYLGKEWECKLVDRRQDQPDRVW